MRIAIPILLLLASTGAALASGSGLEVPPGTRVYVLVESLSEDAKHLGLTKDFIQSKVELRLRKNGVPVGTQKDSFASGMYLYISCGVTGKAFAPNIDFKRKVFYRVGANIHTVWASTYHESGIGTHGSSSRYVLESLMDSIDLFANDFLKSNETGISLNKPDAGDGK